VPLGRSALLASYQAANADSVSYATSAGAATFEPDYDVWGVGYTYKFSDRTNLYAGYGRVSASGTLSSTQVDRQQAAMGLRHRF
jgi:predicted porin